MTQYYEVEGSPAASPVDLATMKAWLKVTSASDDVLIQSLINTATEYGEKYTWRSFRSITYRLYLDKFEPRICLRRTPVTSVTSVEHLVSSVLTTVPVATYYLKNNPQFSEILLSDGQTWPTDTDNREQAIQIVFVTEAYPCGNIITDAIKRFVTYAYYNRGDCDSDEIGAKSGAEELLQIIRIKRI